MALYFFLALFSYMTMNRFSEPLQDISCYDMLCRPLVGGRHVFVVPNAIRAITGRCIGGD